MEKDHGIVPTYYKAKYFGGNVCHVFLLLSITYTKPKDVKEFCQTCGNFALVGF